MQGNVSIPKMSGDMAKRIMDMKEEYSLFPQMQLISVGTYVNTGVVTPTESGFAWSGFLDRRTRVNGDDLGREVSGDGATISFKMIFPKAFPRTGKIFFNYSGEQDVAGRNAFFGFKAINAVGGYRLLRNFSEDESKDQYYNEKIYSGEVSVIVTVKKAVFSVYINGEKICTAHTDVDLGTRWYYAFYTTCATPVNAPGQITNEKYIKGIAVRETLSNTIGNVKKIEITEDDSSWDQLDTKESFIGIITIESAYKEAAWQNAQNSGDFRTGTSVTDILPKTYENIIVLSGIQQRNAHRNGYDIATGESYSYSATICKQLFIVSDNTVWTRTIELGGPSVIYNSLTLSGLPSLPNTAPPGSMPVYDFGELKWMTFVEAESSYGNCIASVYDDISFDNGTTETFNTLCTQICLAALSETKVTWKVPFSSEQSQQMKSLLWDALGSSRLCRFVFGNRALTLTDIRILNENQRLAMGSARWIKADDMSGAFKFDVCFLPGGIIISCEFISPTSPPQA